MATSTPAAAPASNLPTPPETPESAMGPGALIAQRYRVIAKLGEGGMGAVYRVEHVHMRKTFALKVLHAEFSQQPEAVARFEREAVAAANIEHPNIAAATDFGKLADGSFFLVLEFVAGRSLRSELDVGRIEPLRALRIARGVAAGLSVAHAKGIVHRDLKPENIMLVEVEGEPDFAKVLDFGIARVDAAAGTGRAAEGQALTQIGAIFGTPEYMSPEQAIGQPVDGRSDLYTLGLILFEMVAGARPFSGSPLTSLRERLLCESPPALPADVGSDIDPRFAKVLQTLLGKVPEDRYSSAKELVAAIDEVLGGSAPNMVPARASQDLASGHAPDAKAAPLSDGLFARVRLRGQSAPRWFWLALALGGSGVVLAVAAREGGGTAASETRPRATSAMVEAKAPPTVASKIPSVAPLPPPPPSASAATPAAIASASAAKPPATPPAKKKSTPARRTGPNGIYIPPLKDWFK